MNEYVSQPDAVRTEWGKQHFSRVTFYLFLLMLLSTAAQLVCGLLMYLLPDGQSLLSSTDMLLLMSSLPLYLVAAPVYAILMKKLPGDAPPAQALGASRFWVILLICFPLLVGGNLLGNILSSAFSGGTAKNPLDAVAMEGSVLSILLLAVAAPVVEELLFRKILIDRTRAFGEKNAMILSAVVFGLFHGNLFQFFYAFAIGLVFSYVYLRTGRVRYSILMHMAINFLGGVVSSWIISAVDPDAVEQLLALAPEQMPDAAMALMPGIAWFALYELAFFGLAIAGFVLLCINAKKITFVPAPLELPKAVRFRTIYVHAGMILFVLSCAAMFAASLLLNR